MNILCYKNADCEHPGIITDWAAEKGYRMDTIRWYRGDNGTDAAHEPDMLVIMGGPMNIYEDEQYPWLPEERRLIKDMIHSGRIVLGICLGSQLIAAALGSKVYRNRFTEIGWFPVRFTGEALRRFPGLPAETEVFHWHGETFDLPEGATLLASSEATVCQAFNWGDNVYAFQFHLEVTKDMVGEFTRAFAPDLVPGEYVQDSRTINGITSSFNQNHLYMRSILDTAISCYTG
jgi:GMP synthase-like glutamine amidotransferase